MGAHIRHDNACKGEYNICGLCLGTGPSCVIYLTRSRKRGPQIDMSRSRCPNLFKITMKKAKKSTKNSPCSNHPLLCPLCLSPSSPAVWKYNLASHIAVVHPGADLELYEELFAIEESEETLMKHAWLNRKKTRVSAKKKAKAQAPTLQISEAHSTRLALR